MIPFFRRRLALDKSEAAPPNKLSLSDLILDFSSNSEAQRQYALQHLGRLVRTLELTPPGGPSDAVLEMGAYMQITPALSAKLGYGEVRGSYLGPLGRCDEKTVVSKSGETFHCFVDHFDAEKDRYPYEDEQFATVLCCELFEHLSVDPMFLFAEVNRILRPGGHLVLSTPNICSLRGLAAVLAGDHPGIFQHFTHPLGDAAADPRHAREYTPTEIRLGFESGGFEIERLETGPQGLSEDSGFGWVTELLREKKLPAALRGVTIHAVGKKIGPVVDRYPRWLYE